ncbi:unnamed protein product [Arabidopsis lyrata]|nr:unnamed protein product [Arabidopsis lyrata]
MRDYYGAKSHSLKIRVFYRRSIDIDPTHDPRSAFK